MDRGAAGRALVDIGVIGAGRIVTMQGILVNRSQYRLQQCPVVRLNTRRAKAYEKTVIRCAGNPLEF